MQIKVFQKTQTYVPDVLDNRSRAKSGLPYVWAKLRPMPGAEFTAMAKIDSANEKPFLAHVLTQYVPEMGGLIIDCDGQITAPSAGEELAALLAQFPSDLADLANDIAAAVIKGSHLDKGLAKKFVAVCGSSSSRAQQSEHGRAPNAQEQNETQTMTAALTPSYSKSETSSEPIEDATDQHPRYFQSTGTQL